MPNGADPHEWEPSAKDIETLTRADLIVENGLGLEGGMTNAFAQAEAAGVKRFVASDHVTVRRVGSSEGADPEDPDQAPGAEDPHLWMDPLTVRDAMGALARAAEERPRHRRGCPSRGPGRPPGKPERRGGRAPRGGPRRPANARHRPRVARATSRTATVFEVVGAIIPSLSSSAEPSAADLAALADKIRVAAVPAIFTELGTPPQVAEAIGEETGAKVVELNTHALPADGSYGSFVKEIATLIADGLR